MSKRNAAAVSRTVQALRDAGRLEACDEALVALVRATADNLDAADPGTAAAASCARAHVAALDRLRGLTIDAGEHDDLAELLGLGSLSAEVGDTSHT